MDIVNLSLSQGSMDYLKNAMLTPLIKALDELLDVDVVKNYRPISNLIFLSKLIERIVVVRIEGHVIKPGLHSKKQFGYKKNHSTEMLLVKVGNNQRKLLNILHDEIGIRGKALSWFRSSKG